MTLRRRDRHRGLTSWAVVLAVLLGALAGAALEFGATTSSPARVSAAERGLVPSTPGEPASAQIEDFDPAQIFGNLTAPRDGPEGVLDWRVDAPGPRNVGHTTLRLAFRLPLSAAGVRDGRSRAPPVA